MDEQRVKKDWLKAEYNCSHSSIRKIIQDAFDNIEDIETADDVAIDEVFDQTRGQYSIWFQIISDQYRRWEYVTREISYTDMYEWSGWPVEEVGSPVSDGETIILAITDNEVHVIEGSHRVSAVIHNKQTLTLNFHICHLKEFRTSEKFEILRFPFDWFKQLKASIRDIVDGLVNL
jgi:hypothetical protein